MTDRPHPFDRILDRHCPDLSPEEREAARDRLRRLALLVIRITRRLEAGGGIPSGDSRDPSAPDTIRNP